LECTPVRTLRTLLANLQHLDDCEFFNKDTIVDSLRITYERIATTSSERMKGTLTKVGFAERGNTWPGRNGEPPSLWLKEPTVEAFAGEERFQDPF
jgi:hypothetical protein